MRRADHGERRRSRHSKQHTIATTQSQTRELQVANGFEEALHHIRCTARTEAAKGRLFERLMKRYFSEDPLYRDRFANVWLWGEWAAGRSDLGATDTGIDLVAEESDGGHCAIQCKCYAAETRIAKTDLDSFISASARAPFTARLVVDTGDEWGPNAINTINGLTPACSVLRFADLANQPYSWPDLSREAPEALRFLAEPLTPLPHQAEAIESTAKGFEAQDRGKLIMACGTGKTFTSLRISEGLAGAGKTVLYLVPSIALMGQAMREWATQRTLPHRYIGICSDVRAGYDREDAPLEELEIPVTTKADAVTSALGDRPNDAMTVIFCTYQSLEIVEQAQAGGAPEIDLAVCDEAHRTTGVEAPDDRTSPFVLIHDAARIRARKRLYMTATPRLYTEGARARATTRDAEVFSMDDASVYGDEFYRLPFSRAVEQQLLSDYKVVVLALSEEHVEAALQAHLAQSGSEINITDAAKIVGCWRALQSPEGTGPEAERTTPLTRAIAFTNTIAASKRLDAHWDDLIGRAIEQLPEEEQPMALRCETRHVDGKHHALERKSRLEWLEGSTPNECRVLSNARCLTEGVNVPALDAVLFMSPRNSQIDIVQAVGRVMRKAEGKEYGYIILPIAVPANMTPEAALNDNARFAQVWGVLRALRSHDDRLDAEINQIDLNKSRPKRIILGGDGENGSSDETTLPLPFPPLDLPPGVIFAKIVERCGDRKYWETWAKDVADIFARLVARIKALLDNADNDALREWFDAFHDELRTTINDSIDRADAMEMMAQHILTRPVFNALFEPLRLYRGQPGRASARRAAQRLRGVRSRERNARPGRFLRERADAGARTRQQRGAPARTHGAVREVLREGAEEGRGAPRDRIHGDRGGGLHPQQRRSRVARRVRPELERRGSPRPRRVYRHRNLLGAAHSVGARQGWRPRKEVPHRAARQRTDPARVLHRRGSHRRGLSRAPGGRHGVRALRGDRPDGHVQPPHRTERVPQGLAAEQQRTRGAAAEDTHPSNRREPTMVGRPAKRS